MFLLNQVIVFPIFHIFNIIFAAELEEPKLAYQVTDFYTHINIVLGSIIMSNIMVFNTLPDNKILDWSKLKQLQTTF